MTNVEASMRREDMVVEDLDDCKDFERENMVVVGW